MKKKATVISLTLTAFLICLLGTFVLTVAQDEPPPDISDLEFVFSPPEESSFWDYLNRGELKLSNPIKKQIENVNSSAYKANPDTAISEIHKRWNMEEMDKALANIPSEFWDKFDVVMQAPAHRELREQTGVLENMNLASIVKYKALRLAQQGDPDASLRLAAKMVIFGQKLSESCSSLVELLGGICIRSMGYTTMGEIVGNYPVSPQCLREMQETVRHSRISDEDLRNIIKGEFCSMRHFILEDCMSSISRVKLMIGRENFDGTFLSIPYAADICPQPILLRPNETIRIYAEWTRKTLDWTGYNSPEIRKSALFNHEDEAKKYAQGRFPYDPYNAGGRLTLLCFSNHYQGAFHRRLVVNSQASALEAMLAAREYELQHGTLPDSLEKLVPKYLPAVPLDFVDSQPIRYSMQIRAVWSVGRRLDLVAPLPRPQDQDDREALIFRLSLPSNSMEQEQHPNRRDHSTAK